MKLLPIRSIPRLALAITVSAWMAGAGCLFGCSNEIHASSSTASSVETIVATDSCAASHSHDCCAKKRNASGTNSVTSNANGQVLVSALPSRAMETCPMAVSASAIVSKSHADSSNVAVTKRVELPCATNIAVPAHRSVNTSNVFNRGPTYIRCCTFLI